MILVTSMSVEPDQVLEGSDMDCRPSVKSCKIHPIRVLEIGRRLGKEKMLSYIENFGLTEPDWN